MAKMRKVAKSPEPKPSLLSTPPQQQASPRKKIQFKRPWLYPKQLAAIFEPKDLNGKLARYSLIEASTKTGKTVGSIAWLFERAALSTTPGSNHWWVAPVYGQAEIAFRRMKASMPRNVFTSTDSPPKISLINGSTIWFKSGETPDNLYGEDVYDAVVDEASRLRAESFYALRTTMTATRGPLRIIGNVKGRKNWFYAMARKAEAGTPNMSYHRIIAADAVAAGVLDAEEIADAQSVLPANVFKELYLSEPSDDEGNPFGFDAIRKCVGELSSKPAVLWAFDLGKSVDWTVGIALDEDGAVCNFVRWQLPWPETCARIVTLTAGLPTLIDSTGLGDPVLEFLQKAGGQFEGFKFSSQSKQQIMEGLAVAIQSGAIKYPDGAIVSELEQFEYQYTRTGVRYGAPEGFHDDCVCALALANHKRTSVFAGWGVFEYYKRGAAEVVTSRVEEIKHTTSLNLNDGAKRMRMPINTGTLYGITGKSYFADKDGLFIATGEDAEAFRKQGIQASP